MSLPFLTLPLLCPSLTCAPFLSLWSWLAMGNPPTRRAVFIQGRPAVVQAIDKPLPPSPPPPPSCNHMEPYYKTSLTTSLACNGDGWPTNSPANQPLHCLLQPTPPSSSSSSSTLPNLWQSAWPALQSACTAPWWGRAPPS